MAGFITANASISTSTTKTQRFITNLADKYDLDLEKTEIDYSPVPKKIVLKKGTENYINPITGEYFVTKHNSSRLKSSGNIAKEFEFNIHYSIISDPFSISSSTLKVYSTSKLYHASGNLAWPDEGSTYSIMIDQGVFRKRKTVSFPINDSQTSTFGSGWNTDRTATIEISNDGSYDRYNYYLVGSGTVYND